MRVLKKNYLERVPSLEKEASQRRKRVKQVREEVWDKHHTIDITCVQQMKRKATRWR